MIIDGKEEHNLQSFVSCDWVATNNRMFVLDGSSLDRIGSVN